MKEWIYRKGFEEHPTGFKPKWYHYIFFFGMPIIMYSLLIEQKHFVDMINEKGKIRRIYVLEERAK